MADGQYQHERNATDPKCGDVETHRLHVDLGLDQIAIRESLYPLKHEQCGERKSESTSLSDQIGRPAGFQSPGISNPGKHHGERKDAGGRSVSEERSRRRGWATQVP